MKATNLFITTAVWCGLFIFRIFAFTGDFLMQSQDIPGGIDSTQTPQFIGIGFDDNYEPAGMKWITDTLKNKKNPPGINNSKTYDGTPVRVSFFCNTDNSTPVTSGSALAQSYITAFNDGHEIGNHTKTHLPNNGGDQYTFAQWKKEINDCATEFKSAGITTTIFGFRTPYLEYNENTFKALDSLKFKYDCSIESGYDAEVNGTNFFWPYTLDSASDDDPAIGRHPGLWEMPPYYMIIPPELRAQIKKKVPFFDTTFGKCTGLDWNLLAKIVGDSCLGMTKAEYLTTLKYNLDQRLKGNRAPFLIGLHSQFYTSQCFADLGAPYITYQEMRAVVQDFINYALTKLDVRIVPMIKILEWCRNPSSLNGTDIVTQTGSKPSIGSIIYTNNRIRIQLADGSTVRNISTALYTMQGRRVTTTCHTKKNSIEIRPDSGLSKGVYTLIIYSDNMMLSKKIML